MKKKMLVYAFVPAMLGVGLFTVNIASAHGWFGGFGTLSPDEIATRQQERFQHEAAILGISVDEVKNAWAQGKSLWELATEKGITQDQINQRMKDAFTQQMKTQIQALVDKGVITQTQADTRLQFMQNNAQNGKRMMGMGMRFHHEFGF